MIPINFFSEKQDILQSLLTDRSTGSFLSISSLHLPKTISPELILQKIILPRAQKNVSSRKKRTKSHAEVFTPAWVCNIQNNLIDNYWFKKKNLFNQESFQGWLTNHKKIPFENELGWIDYISQNRLEICCGEAPYLTSRYDAVSGNEIKVADRIGLLDRKLRVISENTTTKRNWQKYAIIAYQSIYGYEKNGDSLILARINLFYTFVEFFINTFNENPSTEMLKKIAFIVSWNVWQMDCLDSSSVNNCYIMDWQKKKKVKFTSFLE